MTSSKLQGSGPSGKACLGVMGSVSLLTVYSPLSCQRVSLVPMLAWLLLSPLLPLPRDH